MANHRQAKKRHRQSLKRRARNRHLRASLRNAVRQVRQAAESGADDAQAVFANAERVLRRSVSKGVMHSRTASRTISRLAKLVSS